jgi:hypothetical protein
MRSSAAVPDDETRSVALAQSDDAFVRQAMLQMQRELGAIGAKLDRVISDVEDHGAKIDDVREKIDDLRHKVSFVRGGIWVLGGLAVMVGWLLSHNITTSIADLVWRMTPPSATTPK